MKKCSLCGKEIESGYIICSDCAKNPKTSDEMFTELGFRKNMSSCYSEEAGVLLYEMPVMDETDCFSVYFQNGKVLYTNTANYSVWMNSSLLYAITKKLEELGW